MSNDQQTRDRVALAVASLPPGASPITIAEAALDAVHSPATGAELIAAERTRQVLGEGWTPDHDRRHAPGALAAAGGAYIICAQRQLAAGTAGDAQALAELPPPWWPFEPSWWKPKDPIRNLIRGGALAAAEVDRLQQP